MEAWNVLQLPITTQPVVMAYNLPLLGNDTRLVLTPTPCKLLPA
jgi:hypothetical protein